MSMRYFQTFRRMFLMQRKAGHQQSNHHQKEPREVQYKRVLSDASLKKHLSVSRKFAAYIVAHRPDNRNNYFNADMAKRFLADSARQDLAPKTLKGYVTTLNHLLIDSGQLDEPDKLSSSELGLPSVSIQEHRYKRLTSSEWRLRHNREYEHHKQLIDTARAFGLRREGLLGNGKQKTGLTQHSFYNLMDGTLCAFTVEKGGKLRLAPCREDMEGEMRHYYGQYADNMPTIKSYPRWQYTPSNDDVTRFVYLEKLGWLRHYTEKLAPYGARFLKKQANDRPLLRESGKNIPLHIFRAEYARKLLQQQNEVYIEHFNAEPSANKYMGFSKVRQRPAPRERADSSTRIPQLGPLYYVQALRDVAVALGHNRLDVLSHYI